MSNWDDEDWDDEDIVAKPAAEPAGDWDDEDEDAEAAGGSSGAAQRSGLGFKIEEDSGRKASTPMRPKKALQQALKQREADERAREAAAIAARERELAELSAVERKLKQQAIVEEADLENAKDLFSGGSNKAGVVSLHDDDRNSIDRFDPKTDADYEHLAHMLGQRLCPLNTNPRRTGRYVQFLKHTMRALTKDLNADDTNDLSTFLGVLSNEKRDEQKRAKGIKKRTNKKATVKVDRADDMRSDRYDDFADDFM